jgi:alpha-mannosidase
MSNANEITLLVVPHTHWDREWYKTFQQFRIRLVRTVDKVLDLLECDPGFTYFMLDGQAIVLEDYLAVRPENAERVRRLARQGRLLVGPWYLQPDEFLVGGESLIRNLQIGVRLAKTFGGAMPVGYVPDTFGHIAQLPQILRGFGLDNAVFWRGVPPEIKRGAFHWYAPDGSEVLAIWLYDEFGYSNAAHLPLTPEGLAARVGQIASRMRERALGDVLLFMNGSDHVEPQAGLPAAVSEANRLLDGSGQRLVVGTLPQYIDAVREYTGALPEYHGELRSSYTAHLLPGVLSTRMWLKQRNAASEAWLTRWAEPAATWAWVLGDEYPASLLRMAWGFLLQNHPHDSICGCGIDQVHREMLPRFDQSDQIAEEVTTHALALLARQVRTRTGGDAVPVVVFNPAGGPRSDVVRVSAQLRFAELEVVDDQGRVLPHQLRSAAGAVLMDQQVDKSLVLAGLAMASEGQAMGYTLIDAWLAPSEAPGEAHVEIVVSSQGEPDPAVFERARAQAAELAARDDITTFHVVVREAQKTEALLLARDVPAHGGRVLFLRPAPRVGAAPPVAERVWAERAALQNEHLRVAVDPRDGSLTLHDKRTGQVYSGLNRLVDGGDVGDLYTYCPPATETLVTEPLWPPRIELLEEGPVRATLRVTREYGLPAACTDARDARSPEYVTCRVVSDVTLAACARRVEIRTTVDNQARDHRLRAHFPVPFDAEAADAEGVFEVRRRPARQSPPESDILPWSFWAEEPVNTHPQQRFVDVSDGQTGLAVLNRGLAEYELLPGADGQGSELAVTLLRCVGWLSRDDLKTRRGHAGPPLATPEAQGLGTHVFEYALAPHAGTWTAEDAHVQQEALAFESSLRAVVAEQHDGTLPPVWSFVHVEPASVVVSSIKRAEDRDGLIVRVYNPLPKAVTAEMILPLPFRAVRRVNLNEAPVPEAEDPLVHILNTGVRFELRGGQVATLFFELEPRDTMAGSQTGMSA